MGGTPVRRPLWSLLQCFCYSWRTLELDTFWVIYSHICRALEVPRQRPAAGALSCGARRARTAHTPCERWRSPQRPECRDETRARVKRNPGQRHAAGGRRG